MIDWILYQSAWAAMTKCHRMGGLNNRNVFSRSSKSQKSKNNMPSGLVSGEIFLPGLVASPSHHALTGSLLCGCNERQIASFLLLLRTPALFDQGLTLMTSFKLNCLPQSPISQYSHIRDQGFNIGIGRPRRRVTIQSKTDPEGGLTQAIQVHTSQSIGSCPQGGKSLTLMNFLKHASIYQTYTKCPSMPKTV